MNCVGVGARLSLTPFCSYSESEIQLRAHIGASLQEIWVLDLSILTVFLPDMCIEVLTD
jgi:hypothetical protein